RIIVHVDVNVSVVIDVSTSAFSHHQHGGGLASTSIAACGIAGFERGIELFRQLSLGGLKCLAHGFRYLRPNKNISLSRPGLALPVAGPVGRVRPRISRNVSFGIHNCYLASIFALEFVVSQNLLEYLRRGHSLPQEIDRLLAIADIHIRLRCYGAHIRHGPRHHRPDGEITRCHSHSKISVLRINGYNGKGGNRGQLSCLPESACGQQQEDYAGPAQCHESFVHREHGKRLFRHFLAGSFSERILSVEHSASEGDNNTDLTDPRITAIATTIRSGIGSRNSRAPSRTAMTGVI